MIDYQRIYDALREILAECDEETWEYVADIADKVWLDAGRAGVTLR